MTYILLIVFGLCLGSFVNALVWRLGQQLDVDGLPKKLTKKTQDDVSITKGRSMCPNCKHTLAWYDLVPVFSWLSLGGKCRYCKKPISKQYPLIEVLVSILFIISYAFWPLNLSESWALVGFITWLIMLVGLVALALYDVKHMLLPDRILFPLIIIATSSLVLQVLLGRPTGVILDTLYAICISAGIFWVLYQVSKGAWIGGGDIKLGILAGTLLASPSLAFLYLFVASLLGVLYSLPLMLTKRLTRASRVPFGPFLIGSLLIVTLWGSSMIDWYTSTILGI